MGLGPILRKFIAVLFGLAVVGAGLAPTLATDLEKFLPVKLVCPGKKGGQFILSSENVQGLHQRILIIYDNSSAVEVRVGVSRNGAEFDDWLSVKLNKENDALLNNMALKAVDKFGAYSAGKCFGSKGDRNRYLQELEDNRRTLRREREASRN